MQSQQVVAGAGKNIEQTSSLNVAVMLLGMIANKNISEKATLRNFINRINDENYQRYNTKLYNTKKSFCNHFVSVSNII